MNTSVIFLNAFPPHGKMFLQEKDFHNEKTRTPRTRVADPHHFNMDPDPDPSFIFNADPDPNFHFDPDPDLTFHFNADPDPASHLRPLICRPSNQGLHFSIQASIEWSILSL